MSLATLVQYDQIHAVASSSLSNSSAFVACLATGVFKSIKSSFSEDEPFTGSVALAVHVDEAKVTIGDQNSCIF